MPDETTEPIGPTEPTGPNESSGPAEPSGPNESSGPAGRDESPAPPPPPPPPQAPPPPPQAPLPPPPPGGYPTAPGGAGGYAGPYPRRLTRRMDGRLIGGVANGLGSYFNVDPVVFRVGFVALTLAGGAGILIYLLCWVLLPPAFGPNLPPGGTAGGSPHQGKAIMSTALRQGGWKTYLAIGAVLLAVVILFSPFTRPPVVLALLLIALGVLLLVQDQPGGAAPGARPAAEGPEQAATATTALSAGQGVPTGQGAPAGQEHWGAGAQPDTPDPHGAWASAPAGGQSSDMSQSSDWGQPPGWSQGSGWGEASGSPPSVEEGRGGWGSSATAVAERAPRPRAVIGWVTVALALLAGGVAGALDNFGAVNVTPAAMLALMLTVIGAGLLVASVWGRAGWLILLGVLLVPVVAATSLLNDMSVTGETGDRVERPLTLAGVNPEYRLTAGQLTIDLSQVHFGSKPTAIKARVSAGELLVTVPAEQPVTVNARAGIGDIQVLGHQTSGVQIRSDIHSGGRPGKAELGQLTIDLRIGVGSIRVVRGP
jgi:phage shock protein PspC (stress-responsive transcriptional regulator)